MTRPRKELVCPTDTPFYHIVSRCVRRAFLCGFDHETQRDYEHRRQWIEHRIQLLSSLFSIDICAYSVMSNHYHIVVKLVPEKSLLWTDNEIISRWTTLFRAPLLIQRRQQGITLCPEEQRTVDDIISVWRQRLSNLSWFMKCLNEPIARLANKEDNCTGHFWEARYKSQALMTEEALLSCMAYVDLNPVRAGIADTLETSNFTSIKERIIIAKKPNSRPTFNHLLHFDGNITPEVQTGIPFDFHDYLILVDWTGRILRPDKHGAIAQRLPPILERLEIDRKQWIQNSCQFERYYHCQLPKQEVNN